MPIIPRHNEVLETDPLWYKDAIIYELHVRAFQDSNADGMGDFKGLTQKLDYLEDLGVTAIWLLPFFPSPWRDDGYDISDFRSIHPAYGNLKDFQAFLKEAHRRGLRVITELVINHTSDQHEWFQKSRRAEPGSTWRDFYVWSDTPDRYQGVRIIFKDFEPSNWSWDPVAKSYYWHRFFSHQPDLNFDNPLVRRTVMRTLDYWAQMGVDGFRLDAIPYLFEREGTSCENLPETHAFLREVRSHLDEKFPDRMLLSEANMWPEDAVAYMGKGDECHMNFHFPLMPRLFMALQLEDRLPVVEILNRTPALPETCQWAMFLRNHDELTLEMVTDDERDYMWRAYARDKRARINLGIRRRLAPLLQNDRARIEVMNALLFSMPGTPVLYYGDEIGMGDNVYLGDRNGVRTPMQWSPDRNAGFSRANPQQLYLPVNIDPEYHYEAVNAEAQQDNPQSLLNWTKRMISLRKQHKAFGRGTLEWVLPTNQRVLAFVRRYEEEVVLVVVNLSRFAQACELPLEKFESYTPVEMLGRNDFPAITKDPYRLTLGPNSFFWFLLEKRPAAVIESQRPAKKREGDVPVVYATGEHLWEPLNVSALAAAFPRFLIDQTWFRSPDRRFRSVAIENVIEIQRDKYVLVLLRAEYTTGDPETYAIPIAIAEDESALTSEQRDAMIARVRLPNTRVGSPNGRTVVLFDAAFDGTFTTYLLEAFARRRKFAAQGGEVLALRNREFRRLWGESHPSFTPAVMSSAVVSSTIKFGDRFVLRLLRKVDPGIHPTVEMGEYLTERAHFDAAEPYAGQIELQFSDPSREPITLGVLHGYLENEGDGWHVTRQRLAQYYQSMKQSPHSRDELAASAPTSVYDLNFSLKPQPKLVENLIGPDYLNLVRQMGRRVAELHKVLAKATDPSFAPEPFNDFYRQSLYQGNVSLTSRRIEFLRQHYAELTEDFRPVAQKVIGLEQEIVARFRRLYEQRIPSVRMRFHGRLHLGHLLVRNGDIAMFDFGGDPYLHISERRIKRCPLRDVTSMLYSFGYAGQAAARQLRSGEDTSAPDWETLRVVGRFWYSHVSAAFVASYWEAVGDAPWIPKQQEQAQVLLDNYLLERALLDIRRDIEANPELAGMPLRVILHLLGAE